MPKRKLARLDKGLGDLAREVVDHRREIGPSIRKAARETAKKLRWKLKGVEGQSRDEWKRWDELKKQDPRRQL